MKQEPFVQFKVGEFSLAVSPSSIAAVCMNPNTTEKCELYLKSVPEPYTINESFDQVIRKLGRVVVS